MKYKIILVLVLSMFLISLISASSYPIFLKPINATTGRLMPNQTFSYTFNFSTNSDCTEIILENKSIITRQKIGNL